MAVLRRWLRANVLRSRAAMMWRRLAEAARANALHTNAAEPVRNVALVPDASVLSTQMRTALRRMAQALRTTGFTATSGWLARYEVPLPRAGAFLNKAGAALRTLTHHIAAHGRRRVLIGVLGAIALVILTGTAWNVVAAKNTAEARGKTLYARHCIECHGENGTRLPIAPLNSREFIDQRGDVSLLLTIREGKGIMSAWSKGWGGPLDDNQVTDIVAYINSLTQRPTPLALAARGKSVYATACASCHGEQGDRVQAALLSSDVYLSERSDSELVAGIEAGRGIMPPQAQQQGGPLAKTDVEAVVAYLRSRVTVQLAGTAGRGREIYRKRCYSCHGEGGDRLPNVLLSSPSYLHNQGDSLLTLAVAMGSRAMPAFSATRGGPLSPDDIETLLTYLKVWSGGLPLTPMAGGVGAGAGASNLYTKNCVPCHGQKGDKVAKVALMAREFLEQRGELTLADTVARGKGAMPAWSKGAGGALGDEEVRALVQFLIAKAGASAAVQSAAVGSGTAQSPSGGGAAPAHAAASPTVSPPAASSSTNSAKAPGTAAPAAAASSAGGDPAKGKDLFGKQCSACHGESRDKMPTAKLADSSWLQQRGDSGLVSGIGSGKGGMPGFGKAKGGALSDDDITSIVAYLKQAAGGAGGSGGSGGSGSPAAAPTPKPKPKGPVVMTPTMGKELYQQNCAMCHGQDGNQRLSTPLGTRDWLMSEDSAYLAGAIASGSPGAGMPAWGEEFGGSLSRQEINAILNYLESIAK